LRLLGFGDIAEIDRQPVLRRISTDSDPHPQRWVVLFEAHGYLLRQSLAVLLIELRVDGFGELVPQVLPKELLFFSVQDSLCFRIQVDKAPLVIQGEEGVSNTLEDASDVPSALYLFLYSSLLTPKRTKQLEPSYHRIGKRLQHPYLLFAKLVGPGI
jgi:hypothetical protein